MFSWIASRFKRYRPPKRPVQKSSTLRTSQPAVIRVGNTLYKGDIVGGISDKTLVELKREGLPAFPKRFEVRLEGDQTFRWVNLRWHHNTHVSFQPVTTWAVAQRQDRAGLGD